MKNPKTQFSLFLVLALTSIGLYPAYSYAATRTWDGGGADNNWNTCANWSTNNCPASTDSVVFNSTSTKDATINAATTVVGFSINAGYTGTITQGGFALTARTFTQAAGTFQGGTATVDYNGAFTLSNSGSGATYIATSGSTTLNGNFTHTGGGTFAHNNGTWTFDQSTTRIYNVASTDTFNNVTINATGRFILTISAGDTLIAAGTLALTNGKANTGTLQANGNVTVASTWDSGSTALTFSDTAAQNFTLTGGEALFDGDITINKTSGTVTLASNLTANATNQDLTITSGTLNMEGRNITVNGTASAFVLGASGTLKLQGGETLTVTTWDSNSGTVEYVGNGNTSTDSLTIKDFGATDYFNLVINDQNATPDNYVLGASLTAASAITVSGGTLQQVTFAITSASYTQSGGTFSGGSGTVDINGDFNLSAGTFTATSNTLSIFGNFTDSGGTFNNNAGSMSLDGADQTLTGANTFNNLAKTVTTAATLTLPASATNIIAGTLTLSGASGQLLSLRSSLAGTQTTLDPQGTTNVSYADVQDNVNSAATRLLCDPGCQDSLNNSNWIFNREIQFTATSSQAEENVSAVNLSLTLSDAITTSTTVDYAVTGGTATGSGTDYTLAAGTATIAAGESTTNITLPVINDTIDESNETIIVTLSNPTAAALGTNATHTYTINDDDNTPTISIDDLTLTETEDSVTGTFTVSLSNASAFPITVDYATAAGSATANSDFTSLGTTTLTFTEGQTSKTIETTVLGDALDEDNETYVINLSQATNATISDTQGEVSITDNDTARVILTQSGGSTNVTEDNMTADTYTVVLDSEPTNDVLIAVSPDAQQTVDQASLTFTSANWNTVQTITVTQVNDSVAEGLHTGSITHTATSADTRYNDISIDSVTINLTDNDTAGVSLTESSGSTVLTEGSTTDTYVVVLTSQPTNNVVITLTPNAQQSVDQTTLTFTPSDWDTTQTILVTAIDDSSVEGPHTGLLTHAATSSDTAYEAIDIASITTVLTDNDAAGVSVTQSGGTTELAEDGTTDSYTLTLSSLPTASVILTVHDTAQATASVASFTFTTENWDTPQTVTVTAVDDNQAEDNHATTFSHTATSTDANYNNLSVDSVTVNISDNDSAGVSLVQSEGTTDVIEGSGNDTYTVVLTSQPTVAVTLNLSASNPQISLSAASLSFDDTNWNTPQTVTVQGVEDTVVEGNHASTITHTATSTESAFNGISIGSITVNLSDNDSEETNQAPSITAAEAMQAIEGTSVLLVSEASDPDGDPLTYLWETLATAACPTTAALTDATQAQATFIAPAAPTCAAFRVTASDGTAEASAEVVIHSLKQALNTATAVELTEQVLAGETGELISVLNDTADEDVIISFGQGLQAHSASITSMSFLSDRYIIVSDPYFDNNTGRVISIDLNTANNLTIDLDADNLNTLAGITVTTGQSLNALYGFKIALGDIDMDGEKEVFVLSPGTENGLIYLLDQQTLEIKNLLLGSEEEQFKSALMTVANVNGTIGEEVLIGIRLASNANRSPYALTLEAELNQPTLAFNGFLAQTDLPSVIDFSQQTADYVIDTQDAISHAQTGDIDGDAFNDYVLASTEACSISVFAGTDDLGTSQNTPTQIGSANCPEASNFASILVADVTGDGLADIVTGFPSAGAGGRLYVVVGRPNMQASGFNLANGQIIDGTAGSGIGAWLLAADYDGDGLLEIFTNKGSSGSFVISTTGEVEATSSGSGERGGSQLGPGGASCALHDGKHTKGTQSYWLMALLSLPIFLIRRRFTQRASLLCRPY